MKNETVRAYNDHAGAYDAETVGFWDGFPPEVLNEFRKRARGDLILNVGSGPGRDAKLLRDKGFEVVCLDASDAMIEMTRRDGFRSVRSDFRHMDFPPEFFSGVWAYTSIIHASKPELPGVLGRIRRMLRKDGVFLIGFIEGEGEGFESRDSMPGSQRYFSYYSGDDLKNVVESVGFRRVYAGEYVPNRRKYIHHIYEKVE
jgi:SAM-dependent methyltransferase